MFTCGQILHFSCLFSIFIFLSRSTVKCSVSAFFSLILCCTSSFCKEQTKGAMDAKMEGQFKFSDLDERRNKKGRELMIKAVNCVAVWRQSLPGDAFSRLHHSIRPFHPDDWTHNVAPPFTIFQSLFSLEKKDSGQKMRLMLSDKEMVPLCYQLSSLEESKTRFVLQKCKKSKEIQKCIGWNIFPLVLLMS